MIFKSLSYWLWFAALAILALILANLPLLNLLAFEFCAILATGISFAGAHIAITSVRRLRRRDTPPLSPPAGGGEAPLSISNASPSQIVMKLFWKSFGVNLTLLVAPLVIILLNALRVKNCNFGEGFLFFLLLPVISCAYATAAGVFFGLWTKKRWTAYLVYLAYIFATLLLLVYNIVFHPPVFGYHSTFGYFPGPIYDERILISGTLLIARGTTLLLTGIFLLLAINTLDESTFTLRWRKRGSEGARRRRGEGARERGGEEAWNASPNLPTFQPSNLPIPQSSNLPSFHSSIPRVLLAALVIAFGLIYLHRGDLGLRPTRSYIEKKLGGLKETEHFKIYYEKDSKVEREIEWIAQDHEFRYAQLIRYFQMLPTKKVRSYIYTTSEQKKRLVGAGETSIEDPLGHGFHINYEDFPHSILKHELAHALTSDWHPILKVSLKIGLHEGIAVAADWDEGRLTAHQWSQAMRQLRIAPTMQQIMGLGFWAQSSSRSYTLAGSFVRFLVDTYGIDKFKGVFPTGNFSKVYNKPLKALVQEWEAFLETVPLTVADLAVAEQRFKRPSIFQKPCAHEIADLSAKAWGAYRRSNFSTAIRLFEQVYRFDRDNPSPLRGLMYAHYQMDDYSSTLALGAGIITHPKVSMGQIAEAKEMEGDVYWQQGQRDQARSRYQEVFELHPSDASDREAQAKLATLGLDSAEVQDKLKQVFISQVSPQLKITLLHEVIKEMPAWGLPYYLIGRQLHFEQDYAPANRYLLKAAAFGLPHQSLAIENARLIGINSYRLGQYEGAIEQFQRIASDPLLPLGVIHNAKDWIERCEWQMGK